MIYLKFAADIWQGPDEFILTNFDGSRKSALPGYAGPSAPDFSAQTNRLIYESDNSLWLIEPGERRAILSQDQYIESPVISVDGNKIAYSLASGFSVEDTQQFWTINPDGTENAMVIDDTGQYITDPGPFRLRPIAWSSDNNQVFMVTTTDSEATPTGLYVADLAAGTIEKALTPQVTLWDVSFSPDRTRIAYRTFQWHPVPGFRPEAGPPFTLNVTDLTTGETRILQDSETHQYYHPIWSEGGDRLAYTARQSMDEGDLGIFVIDLASGESTLVVPGSEISRLRPWLLLSDNTLVYTEGDLSSGEAWQPYTTLYTTKIDGSSKNEIDSSGSITVLAALGD